MTVGISRSSRFEFDMVMGTEKLLGHLYYISFLLHYSSPDRAESLPTPKNKVDIINVAACCVIKCTGL